MWGFFRSATETNALIKWRALFEHSEIYDLIYPLASGSTLPALHNAMVVKEFSPDPLSFMLCNRINPY